MLCGTQEIDKDYSKMMIFENSFVLNLIQGVLIVPFLTFLILYEKWKKELGENGNRKKKAFYAGISAFSFFINLYLFFDVRMKAQWYIHLISLFAVFFGTWNIYSYINNYRED